MTDATPQKTPAAASEPAKPTATTTPGAPVPASSLGGQRSPVDLVREHQSTIVVVLALLVAALAVVMIKRKQQNDLDGRAWEELTNLRQSRSSGTDGFSELAARCPMPSSMNCAPASPATTTTGLARSSLAPQSPTRIASLGDQQRSESGRHGQGDAAVIGLEH